MSPTATIHELKTWPEPFRATCSGRKTHEVRREDGLDFQRGDILRLREWQPAPDAELRDGPGGHYTGQSFAVLVTYVSRGLEWGLPIGLVVMSVSEASGRIAGR